MKYSDRGLADDRFWFNGGNVQRRLFGILFWISNTFFILIQQGNILAHLFYFKENVFMKVYRYTIFWGEGRDNILRVEVCSNVNRITKLTEDFARYRFNNLCSKSTVAVFVILTAAGIYWKKRRISDKIGNNQRNLLTLKQTLGIILFIYCNNVVADYILAWFKPSRLVFLLEEMRVILVENLLIRFLLPIVLIIYTKTSLPALWSNQDIRRSKFYMTKPDFEASRKMTKMDNEGENKESCEAMSDKVVVVMDSSSPFRVTPGLIRQIPEIDI